MSKLICIAGKNNIAVNSVEYLLKTGKVNNKELILIPNEDDKGLDNWQRSLRKFADANNLKTLKLDEVYNIQDLLFISLEFNKIIMIDKFKSKRLYNIHFSQLPKYKGMYTSLLPILNGEKQTGVTLHKIDNGIDTGNIVDQIVFEIDINDTCRDLYFKYNEYAFMLFKRNIDSLVNGNISSIPQPNIDSSYYSKRSINFDRIIIDFEKTSYEIHNQIRAYIFKEYQLPVINGHRIIKSILTHDRAEKPKQIIDKKEYIEITGIDRFIIKAYKEV